MILEVYLISTVVFGAIVEINKNKHLKELYLKAVFLIAFLIAGLRGRTVGLDTSTYFSIFESIRDQGISELPRNTELEKGYMILCWLLSRVSDSPQILIVVNSAIISYSFYVIVKDYSDNYMISSLIFVSTIFTVTMNVMRQYVALSLVFFAIKYITDKQTLKGVVLILIGISIHYSAIILLPLALFSFKNMRFTKFKIFMISSCMLLVIPLYPLLIDVIFKFFPQYYRFTSSSKYSGESEISLIMMLYFLCIIVGFIFSLNSDDINYEKQEDSDNKNTKEATVNNKDLIYYIFFFLFVGYVITYCLSLKFWILSRVIYYFQASQIVVIPNMVYRLSNCKLRKQRLVIYCVVILYFINNGLSYFSIDPHSILPYQMFWE